MFEDDEDDLFSFIIPNSKLSSLFGQTMNQSTPHTNFTFSPPKQPTGKLEEALKMMKTEPSSTIIRKEVRAFKVIEGKNILQGFCGLSIIGKDSNTFQLLMYKHQNDVVSAARIHRYFEFTVEHDNYASYCDDNKLYWRVQFSSEADVLEFSDALMLREVKLLKADKKPPMFKKPLNDIYLSNEASNTRMAKMGNKMKVGDYNKVSSESDSDEVAHPYLNSRKFKWGQSVLCNKREEVSQGPANVSDQHLIMNGQYFPLPPPLVNPSPLVGPHPAMLPLEPSPFMCAPPHFVTEQLNVFFAENRTHNAEVRMNVVRLTAKMEEILDKFTRLDQQPEQGNQSADELLKVTVKQQKEIIEEMRRKYDIDMRAKETELSESAKERADKNLEHLELIHKLQSELSEQNKIMEEIKNAKLEKKFAGVDEKLKKTMNELYHSIASDVKDENTYTGNELKSILATRIRQYTYYIVSLFDDLNTPKPTLNDVSADIEE